MVTTIKREDFCFLVVDDFATMRRIISGLLRELGFKKILEAEDGKVALRVLEGAQGSGEPVHFVLSDVNMPVMNGFQMLESLRTRPEGDPLQKIPVLLVTAEGRKEDILRAAQLGATGYVVKPFNKDTIGDKIHLALKHRNILVE
ncbi:response regulator [Roseateles depolymerans]|jgi:two-component system chemotaxis response regulator CheY|uniref:Chemotaxis protein CheY n=1 Tax=Roseateles depolymerans TaxID=76731 RepID=A0A0U3LHV6_9BURK|nr:response regulator [Roseateles depolymerans]ALV06050.1 chemotaxis protein CheY [Roseateles depolymerans]REG11974.1 two-component system chemotaxis response regulator CheY [Roseateles depolymerans]